MNYRNCLIVLDFETGSKNKYKTQATQLGAVAIDPRKLEIMDNGVFNSFIQPILDDEKAKAAGLDPLEDEALKITNISRDQLKDAPTIEPVWKNFTAWVQSFNSNKKTKNVWDAPIMCGYNIVNFDCALVDRYCELYDPWDKTWQTQNLFHPVHKIDLIHDVWRWFESIKINNSNSISLDSLREYMGITKDGAHQAIKDCFDCAYLLIKFLKLYRVTAPKVRFEKSFDNENIAIAELLKKHA